MGPNSPRTIFSGLLWTAHPCLCYGSGKPRRSWRRGRGGRGWWSPRRKPARGSGCETQLAERWDIRGSYLVTLTMMNNLVRLIATRRPQVMVNPQEERQKQRRAADICHRHHILVGKVQPYYIRDMCHRRALVGVWGRLEYMCVCVADKNIFRTKNVGNPSGRD